MFILKRKYFKFENINYYAKRLSLKYLILLANMHITLNCDYKPWVSVRIIFLDKIYITKELEIRLY